MKRCCVIKLLVKILVVFLFTVSCWAESSRAEDNEDWIQRVQLAVTAHQTGSLNEAIKHWQIVSTDKACPIRFHALHLAAQARQESLKSVQTDDREFQQSQISLIQSQLITLAKLKEYPLRKTAQRELCQLLQEQADWEMLLRQIPAQTDDVEYRYLKALAMVHTGHGSRAESLLRNLWIDEPASVFAEKIELLYREVLDSQSKSFPSVNQKQLFNRARSLDKSGLRKQAADLYTGLIDDKLSTELAVKSLIYKAKILSDTRENTDAMNSYHRFISTHPSHASVPTALFRQCIIHKREQDDSAYLEKSARIIRNHSASKWWPITLMGRGDYWRSHRQWEKAGEDYRRVIHNRKKYRDTAYWKWAWLAHDYGNYDRAITRMTKIQSLYPGGGWDLPTKYWKVRFQQMQGKKRLTGLQTIAEEHPWSYYGQQAAVRLALNATDTMAFDTDTTQLDMKPSEISHAAVQAAIVLEEVELWDRAASEWQRAVRKIRNDSDGLIYRLARALQKAGDIPASRRILVSHFSDELETNHLPVATRKLLYPIPVDLKPIYLESARRVDLDPMLAMAVTLQESGYDHKALSHNLAGGLMQVMPELFRRFSTNWNPVPNPENYSQPAMSIRAGTEYLAWLLNRFDGSIPKALAGYNAGEHRVEEWETLYPYPDEIWVEHIPFQQTRMFVKHVWKNYHCYQRIYGREIIDE